MKWHLYKKDDPNTWPKVDCPMVVCLYHPSDGEMELHMCKSFVKGFGVFMFQDGGTCCTECYYAYIGYVPSGYKTTYPIRCMRDGDRCAYEDDGYCMFESECEFAKEVPEYSIEEKRIWKEFE